MGAPHGAEPARAETLEQSVAAEQQLTATLRALVGDTYARTIRGSSNGCL
jgi:hypothetical protein